MVLAGICYAFLLIGTLLAPEKDHTWHEIPYAEAADATPAPSVHRFDGTEPDVLGDDFIGPSASSLTATAAEALVVAALVIALAFARLFEWRRGFHLRWAAAFLVTWALLRGVALRDFHALAGDGRVESVTVTGVAHEHQSAGSHRATAGRVSYTARTSASDRWSIRGTWRDDTGEHITQGAVGSALFRCAAQGTCVEVPFLVSVRSRQISQAGTVARLPYIRALSLLLLLLLVPAYALHTRFARRSQR